MYPQRCTVLVGMVAAMWMAVCTAVSGGELGNALRKAAAQGHVEAVHAVLAQGAPLDTQDAYGATALLIATHKNHVAVAKLLIEAGADVNLKDSIQDSPYLYAAARGRNEILRMTLAFGADLQSTNRYGGTALTAAAERGLVDTVRILIEAGVAVNHVNKLHWTALLEAIVLGNGGPEYVEVVRQLLEAKADVHLADIQDVTPLQHARQRGWRQMEALLLAAGAQR